MIERRQEERAHACFGDVLEVLQVERVNLVRRYSCIRRDQYELTTSGPFPDALRVELARRGTLTGTDALWVLDVPGAYHLTVAPRAGRAVLIPRLASDPSAQRSAALDVAAVVDMALAHAEVEGAPR